MQGFQKIKTLLLIIKILFGNLDTDILRLTVYCLTHDILLASNYVAIIFFKELH